MGKTNPEESLPGVQTLEKQDFIDYLKILFPLIEGAADSAEIRLELQDYIDSHNVPSDIESMLKDLFLTKFKEPLQENRIL